MYDDPISPTGRAVQAKTQGMTDDQIQQVAQQYDQMGLMSFDDVMTLKQRLDVMKQSGQQQPPPSTTVAQDLQRQAQQMQGVAGLPVNVGNPSNYARGGIVAFANAGPVGYDPYAGMTPEERATYEGKKKYGPYEGMSEAERKAYEERVLKDAPKDTPKAKGKSRTSQAKNALTKERSLGGLAKGAGRFVKGAAALNAGIGAIEGATAGDVSTNELRDLYKERYGRDENSGVPGDKFFLTDWASVPEEQRPWYAGASDPAVRLLATTDAVLDKGTFGLSGLLDVTDPFEEIRSRRGNKEAATAAAGKKEQPFDFSKLLTPDEGNGGAAILRSVGRSGADMSGFNNAATTYADLETRKRARADRGRGAYYDELSEDAKNAGLMSLYPEERERIKAKMAALEGEQRKGKWLSAADGFFKMAEAAGQDGATFMGAAGAGGAKGTESYRALLDKIEARRDKLDDADFNMRSAENQQRTGLFNSANQERTADEAAADAAMGKRADIGMEASKLNTQVAMANAQNETATAVAEFSAGNRDRAMSSVKRAMAIAQKLREKAWGMASGPQRQQVEQAAESVLEWGSKMSAAILGYSDPRMPSGGGNAALLEQMRATGALGGAAPATGATGQGGFQYLGTE